MNLLQRALIEKAGHDNDFENVWSSMAGGFEARLLSSPPSLPGELVRWLRRAAVLAQALPNQSMTALVADVQAALGDLEPAAERNSEVQRVVRQSVRKQAFRKAMLDYWQGSCAVTGLARHKS